MVPVEYRRDVRECDAHNDGAPSLHSSAGRNCRSLRKANTRGRAWCWHLSAPGACQGHHRHPCSTWSGEMLQALGGDDSPLCPCKEDQAHVCGSGEGRGGQTPRGGARCFATGPAVATILFSRTFVCLSLPGEPRQCRVVTSHSVPRRSPSPSRGDRGNTAGVRHR